MPCFNIVKESTPTDSFRLNQVRNSFDFQAEKVIERFIGDMPIEGLDYNIGLIVGHSGTGKTVIAREIFKEDYLDSLEFDKSIPVLDAMPAEKTYNEIAQAFSSVGFASVPSWLKPYNVLSTGEKMRVDLAWCLLSGRKRIVFDEFTSVVDRDVAKVASACIAKSIRRANKQFIAVSCHEDITDWLCPDWIFNTNTMTF